jgi:hypothetical protein
LVFSLVAVACAGKQPAAQHPGVVAKPPGPEAGPPVILLPAATARPLELASVSIGSFNQVLDRGVRLVGQAVPLPMTADSIRDALISQAGLPAVVGNEIDFAQPFGAAVVALDDKGTSGAVFAVSGRSAADAEKLIDALGKRMMTRGTVTLVTSTSGGTKSEGWVYRADKVVVLSDQLDALTRGAMLAIEAMHATPDDITTTLFPDAIARSHGTDVTTAIARLLEQARAMQGDNAAMLSDPFFFAQASKLLHTIANADHIELGLTADPTAGLVLRSRLYARQGSELEAVARNITPFEVDADVRDQPGQELDLLAMGIGPGWRALMEHSRARLGEDKSRGSAAALAYYDLYLDAMGQQSSDVLWVEQAAPFFGGVMITALKDAPTSARLSKALGKMDVAAMNALVRAQLGPLASRLDWTARRESVGKVQALHFHWKLGKLNSLADVEALRKLSAAGIDVYQGVVGSRAVVTIGRDARARLAAIAAGKVGVGKSDARPAEMDAEAAAKGREIFSYSDFAPLLGLVGAFSPNPKLAALARVGSGPIPVVVTGGGDGAGKVWSADITFTTAAFRSVGSLITAGMAAFR